MRSILVVSSYPPMRCGIGAYAAQQADALRREGAVVDIFSPPEGEGDFQGNLAGGARPLRLARILWAYEEVHVHFAPSFFYAPDELRAHGVKTSLAMLMLAAMYGRRLRWVIHETAYNVDEAPIARSFRNWIDRWVWRLSAKVSFHSARERDTFARYYGLTKSSPRFEVVDHGRHFVSHCSMDRDSARRSVGIESNEIVFLCIGFVQPHKGFDRAIRALQSVHSPRARLRIVGSVRIAWQPALDYARLLHQEVAKDPRCAFIETFVDDESFDRWIVASDFVIVPYYEIWSSGVAARAQLHGRPIIVADTGALGEQMTNGSRKFKTEADLASILREILT